MAQFRLDGFAIVVGAAGGIGREVAYTFAEAGVKGILLADINSEGIVKAAEETTTLASNPDYHCFSSTVDVTDPASVEAMVNLAVDRFGCIDYCINAFGVDVASNVPFDQTSLDDYDRVLGTNTRGPFLVTRAVGKVMKTQERAKVSLGRHGLRDIGRGCIINVSSAAGLSGVATKAPYTASKHALTGLTRAASMDFKAAGIRVNQVCPTWVRTPMYEEECSRNPEPQEMIEKMSTLKRPIEPDEVASACLYLCSPSTVAMNGISLAMDIGL